MSFDQARELAAAQKKPILIDFTGVNCANCRLMEAGVFPRPEVVSLLKKFVTVQLYTDFVPIGSITPDQREEAGRAQPGTHHQAGQGSHQSRSTSCSLRAAKCCGQIGGYNEPPVFVDFLTKALEKLPEA